MSWKCPDACFLPLTDTSNNLENVEDLFTPSQNSLISPHIHRISANRKISEMSDVIQSTRSNAGFLLILGWIILRIKGFGPAVICW